jgi:hypothetical protein
MSELKLEGKLIAVMQEVQVTDSFKKQEFVLETSDEYPQQVKFELTQGKCGTISTKDIGKDATVHFNVRGRKWVNKKGEDTYFVSLNAWRVETGQAQSKPVEPPVNDDSGDNFPF